MMNYVIISFTSRNILALILILANFKESELLKAHQHIEILNMEKNTLKKMMQKFLDKNQETSFNSNHEEEMILNQLNKSQSHSKFQYQSSLEVKTLPKQKSQNYYKFQNGAYNQVDTFQNTTPLEDEEEYEKVGSLQNVSGQLKQEQLISSLNNINNNSNLLQQLQSQTSVIANQQQRIQQMQRELLTAQQNQTDLINQLTRERQTNLEYKSSISSLMGQLDLLKNQITFLQENNSQHISKLQSYQEQISKQEQIKKHVTQINKEFEDLQEKLEEIDKEKEEYKQSLEKKQQQMNTLQQLNQSMKATIEQLTCKNQEQEELIAQFQSKAEIEKQAAYFIKELLNFFNQEQFEALFSDSQHYPDLLLKLLRFNIDIQALFYDQEQQRPTSQQGISMNGNVLLGSMNNGSLPQLLQQNNPVTNISIIEDEGTTKNRISRITKYGSQNNLLNGQILNSYNQAGMNQQDLQSQQIATFQDQMKWNRGDQEQDQQIQYQQQLGNGGLSSYGKQSIQNQYQRSQQLQQNQNQQYVDILHRKESLESQYNENQNYANINQSNLNQKSGYTIMNGTGGGGSKYGGVDNKQTDDSDHTNNQAFQQYLLKNSHSLQNVSESLDQNNNRNMIQQFLNERNENQEDYNNNNVNKKVLGVQSPAQLNPQQQYQFNTPNQFIKSGYSSPMQVLFSEPQFSALNSYKQNNNNNMLNNNISSSFNPNLNNIENTNNQQPENNINSYANAYRQSSIGNQINKTDKNNTCDNPSSNQTHNVVVSQPQQQINADNQQEVKSETTKTNNEDQLQKEKLPSVSNTIQAKKSSLPDKINQEKNIKQQIRHTTPTGQTNKSPLRTQKSTKTVVNPSKTSFTTSPNVNNSTNSGILKKSKSIQDVKNNSTIANKSYDSKRIDTSTTIKQQQSTGGSYLAENEEKKQQKVQIQTQILAVKQKHISDMDDLDKELEMMKAEAEAEELRKQQKNNQK